MTTTRLHTLSLAAALSFALALPALSDSLFEATAANAQNETETEASQSETINQTTENKINTASGTAIAVIATNKSW